MVIAREQRRARDAAIRLSTIDPLTGLFNRTFFFAAVEREIARSARSGRGFCLLMMDLDELKQINDRHGHFFGDRVLRGVGEVIRSGGRRIDTAARYGGDEFVVLLPETDPTGAYVLAEKIRLGGRRPARSRSAGSMIQPSVSIGVVSYPDDGRTSDELMITADSVDVPLEAGRQEPGHRRAGRWTGGGAARRRIAPGRSSAVVKREPAAAGAEPAVAARASRPTSRCRIGRMADPDARRRRPRTRRRRRRGFATRAIRAAHRAAGRRPGADVGPDLPDRDVLGRRRRGARRGRSTREIPGYAYGRLDNPTVVAFAAAVAELEGAEAGFAFASGMAAIHAALGTLAARPATGSSRRAPSYGTTRAQLERRRSAGSASRPSSSTSPTSRAVEAALAAAPTRVLYAETIANPTIVVADHVALAELAHRYGALYVVDNTFASPYLCRPIELGADLVVESATKYLSGHSDVMAGVVVGATEPGPPGPRLRGRHRGQPRPARRVPRDARPLDARPPDGAPLGDGGGARRLARGPAGRAPGLAPEPAEPSPARGRDAPAGASAAGCSRSSSPAAARPARRSSTRLTIPARTASLGSVFTIVAHPPSTTHRQLDDAALAAARDHRRACCAARSGSRTSTTSSPTSTRALAAAARASGESATGAATAARSGTSDAGSAPPSRRPAEPTPV